MWAWESSSVLPTFDSDGGFVLVVFAAAMRLLLEDLNCAIVRRLLICVKFRYLITNKDKIHFQMNEKHNHQFLSPVFDFLDTLPPNAFPTSSAAASSSEISVSSEAPAFFFKDAIYRFYFALALVSLEMLLARPRPQPLRPLLPLLLPRPRPLPPGFSLFLLSVTILRSSALNL